MRVYWTQSEQYLYGREWVVIYGLPLIGNFIYTKNMHELVEEGKGSEVKVKVKEKKHTSMRQQSCGKQPGTVEAYTGSLPNQQ